MVCKTSVRYFCFWKKVSKQCKMINTFAKGIVKSDVWTEAKFKEAEDKKF